MNLNYLLGDDLKWNGTTDCPMCEGRGHVVGVGGRRVFCRDCEGHGFRSWAITIEKLRRTKPNEIVSMAAFVVRDDDVWNWYVSESASYTVEGDDHYHERVLESSEKSPGCGHGAHRTLERAKTEVEQRVRANLANGYQ